MIADPGMIDVCFLRITRLMQISDVPKNAPLSHKKCHLSKKEPHIWVQTINFRELFMGQRHFLGHPTHVYTAEYT